MIDVPPTALSSISQPATFLTGSPYSGDASRGPIFIWSLPGIAPNSNRYLTRTPIHDTGLTVNLTVHSRGVDPIVVASQQRAKMALISAISTFWSEPTSTSETDTLSLTSATVAAAAALVRLLPAWTKLPTIAPDGEGGLLMAWESELSPLLIVIDGTSLHIVEAATTNKARYIDDIAFDNIRLPNEVLEALPKT